MFGDSHALLEDVLLERHPIQKCSRLPCHLLLGPSASGSFGRAPCFACSAVLPNGMGLLQGQFFGCIHVTLIRAPTRRDRGLGCCCSRQNPHLGYGIRTFLATLSIASRASAALLRTFSLSSFRHPVRARTAAFASGPISPRAAAASPRARSSLSERAVISAGTLGAPISINEPQAAIRTWSFLSFRIPIKMGTDAFAAGPISPKAEAAPSRTPASLSFFSVLTRAGTAESAFGPIPPKAPTTATRTRASLSSRALISVGMATFACGPTSRRASAAATRVLGFTSLRATTHFPMALASPFGSCGLLTGRVPCAEAPVARQKHRQAATSLFIRASPSRKRSPAKPDANRALVAGSIESPPHSRSLMRHLPFHSRLRTTSTAKHPLTCGPDPGLRRWPRSSASVQPAAAKASARVARWAGSRWPEGSRRSS